MPNSTIADPIHFRKKRRARGAGAIGLIGVLIVLHVSIAPARAQYAEAAPTPGPVQGDDDASKVDLVDVFHHLTGRENTSAAPAVTEGVRLLVVPAFGASPSAGFKAGVSALIEFPSDSADERGSSSISTTVTYSTRNQVGASFTPAIHGRHDIWRLEGENSFGATRTDDVVSGSSSEATGQRLDYDATRVVDTLYVRTLPRLFAGVGIVYTDQGQIVRAEGSGAVSPFRAYSLAHGFNLERQTSAGGQVTLQFDNRDNRNDAVRGWLISASLRQYLAGVAGGDSRWQEAFGEIRTYHALTGDKRHRLAFWTYGDFVTRGIAPYLALPMSGGDLEERSNRGYAQGRFRGEQMVYGEIEYRGMVTRNGLIGVVSFVNVATLSSKDTGERLFHSAAVGAGAGLRVLFSKRSRANICLDAGVGRNGSHGVYFGLSDAF